MSSRRNLTRKKADTHEDSGDTHTHAQSTSVTSSPTGNSSSLSSMSSNGNHSSNGSNGVGVESSSAALSSAYSADVSHLLAEVSRLRHQQEKSQHLLSSLTDSADDCRAVLSRMDSIKASVTAELDAVHAHVAELAEHSSRRAKLWQEHTVQQSMDVTNYRTKTNDKIFTYRESALIEMFRQPEIATVYNIFVSLLLLFTMKLFLHEWLNPTEDAPLIRFETLYWNFSRFDVVVPVWIVQYSVHLMVVPLMWAWRINRISATVYFSASIVFDVVFLAVFGVITWNAHLPIASAMILLCEQIRMVMKMHSFVRETMKLGRDSPGLASDVHTQLNQFLLFTWVPTLVFRTSYPRTARIRWSFVVFRFVEVAASIFYTYLAFSLFCLPEFKKNYAPKELRIILLSLFDTFLPSILVYVLAFFGLLHCWMNLFAELTRFADRLFYSDWWNSTDFQIYYRKWNGVVYDWTSTYLYNDLISVLRWPRQTALLFTFVISAIIHEYIITLAIGFFYPILLTLFLGAGVGFIYLTKLMKGYTGWNIFFWTNLIIGNGMLMELYTREYYSRAAAHGENIGYGASVMEFAWDHQSRIPYSFQPLVAQWTKH